MYMFVLTVICVTAFCIFTFYLLVFLCASLIRRGKSEHYPNLCLLDAIFTVVCICILYAGIMARIIPYVGQFFTFGG